MFSTLLARATRRACFKSSESLAPPSSTFAYQFATSAPTELARNSPGSGNQFKEHDGAERIDHGARRTGYERIAGGPVRRARRLPARPSGQVRQSPPPSEISSSGEDNPNEITVETSRKHQVSKMTGHQAVSALIDPGVNISRRSRRRRAAKEKNDYEIFEPI